MSNREIKFEYGFKSVNGIVKKVYHLHEIPFINDKCDVWNVLPVTYVRQYTGLKDRNGVEIYEGDICSYLEIDIHNEDVFINRGVIEYYEWGFNLTNRNGVDMEDIDLTELEIIGNVHQNPELL